MLTLYQYLLNESPQVLLILGRETPWGLVVTDMLTWYQYLLIESPQVLLILGKEAPWGLVVTDTLTWYQYLLIENPQGLLILGFWWLQTCSLHANIYLLRAHKFCKIWEKKYPRDLWLQICSLFTCYQHCKIESPKDLLFLGKEAP